MEIKQNISAGVDSIKENIAVIRAKFNPLLESEQYVEDVKRLLDVIPPMLDNLEAMVKELNRAFNILSESANKEKE